MSSRGWKGGDPKNFRAASLLPPKYPLQSQSIPEKKTRETNQAKISFRKKDSQCPLNAISNNTNSDLYANHSYSYLDSHERF